MIRIPIRDGKRGAGRFDIKDGPVDTGLSQIQGIHVPGLRIMPGNGGSNEKGDSKNSDGDNNNNDQNRHESKTFALQRIPLLR